MKISATLLLILTLSPFTAPFPICDLATLLVPTIPGMARDVNPRTLSASLADTSISHVRPLERAVGRIRLTALFPLSTASAVREVPSVALTSPPYRCLLPLPRSLGQSSASRSCRDSPPVSDTLVIRGDKRAQSQGD